jgi:class 3 adenylate cyclase
VGAPGEIRFARASDGVDIAYLTTGEGPRDLVLIFGFTTHLDLCWDMPWFSEWVRRSSEHFRTIVFDKRGTGLSDRPVGSGSIEQRTQDVLAVMDAVGSERASLVGISEGGPMAIVCASMYPERVERMVFYGAMSRIRWAPDYPEGVPDDVADWFVQTVTDEWGSGLVMGTYFFSHAADPEQAAAKVAMFERNACTRQMARQMIQANTDIDVRALLPSISAPTLVLHTSGDPIIWPSINRYLGEHIPGARTVELPGDYHCSWRLDDADAVITPALAFLTEDLPSAPPARDRAQRVLASVLFTDIVGSTEQAAKLGDAAWGQLLDRHDAMAQREIDRHGGRLVKTTGDGLLATFEGPSGAIEATQAIQAAGAELGLEIRAGVHTGEVERRGDDVSGLGVHIAARVAGLADAGEILTTRTVRELTVGAQLSFSDRGTHTLKGVPESWDLFAVV